MRWPLGGKGVDVVEIGGASVVVVVDVDGRGVSCSWFSSQVSRMNNEQGAKNLVPPGCGCGAMNREWWVGFGRD